MTAADAKYVCEHMQTVERLEREALFGRMYDPSWFVPEVEKLAARGKAYTCLTKAGTPAVIGGISVVENVGIPWMCGTDEIADVVIELTRSCRKALKALQECGSITQVQVRSVCFHTVAHRWYGLLGLKKVEKPAGLTDLQFFVFERKFEA